MAADPCLGMAEVARRLYVSRITDDVHYLFVMSCSEANFLSCVADRTFLERDFGCLTHVLHDMAAYTAPGFFPVHQNFAIRQISRAQIEVISRARFPKDFLKTHLPIMDQPGMLEVSTATFQARVAPILTANHMVDGMRAISEATKALAAAARGGGGSRGNAPSRRRGARGGGGGGGAADAPRRGNTPRRRGGGSPKRGKSPGGARRGSSGSSRSSRASAAR